MLGSGRAMILGVYDTWYDLMCLTASIAIVSLLIV